MKKTKNKGKRSEEQEKKRGKSLSGKEEKNETLKILEEKQKQIESNIIKL